EDGKEHRERRAAAVPALHEEPSTEEVHQPARDAEAEARATEARPGAVELLEVARQLAKIARADADAGVAEEDAYHGTARPAGVAERREAGQGGVHHADVDGDGAGVGELERVREE